MGLSNTVLRCGVLSYDFSNSLHYIKLCYTVVLYDIFYYTLYSVMNFIVILNIISFFDVQYVNEPFFIVI